MADNNPFDDPTVKAAASATGPPPVPQSAYDDNNNQQTSLKSDNNNDNNVTVDINKYVSPQQQQQVMMAAGSSMANTAVNAMKDDYQQSTSNQADHHSAPEKPQFCTKLFNWFPLKLFCFFGGVMLIALPIIDIALSSIEFISFFIFVYLMFFGIVTMFVESPTFKLTRWMQLKIFFWFRILGRMWGRAWFYLFISILCYSELDGGFTATAVAGFYLTFMSLLSFLYSKLAANKYVRCYDFIAAGTEGDELIGKFMRKFDELDADADGRIGSLEIVKLCNQAGREVSNAERAAFQTFLDESCNGYVSKEDWMRIWMLYNRKQKYL